MASSAPLAAAPHPPPPPPPAASFAVRASESAHHRLYEFAKTALIKIFAFPYATVCDLYCGGGADTDKWDDAQIGHYIGVDASLSGISEARDMWEGQRKPYTAEFCELDPSVTSLQSCFESEEKVRSLLRNVSSLLRPGGYFFGITPDSSTIWAKYQKNVEACHNKGIGMKPNAVPSCIRSENYVITFEVEEEKFPLFGKKYQLKFANDMTSETHCLVHFPSLIRTQFAGMLFSYGANFVDPRGKLLARSFDLLGLYSTFVFQKPDPDVVPPVVTPMLHDGNYTHEEHEWLGSSWRQPAPIEEDRNGQTDTNLVTGTVLGEHDKGILGPGPADLRFPDPL
ncbi:hypothetical protein C4D60_Mb01t06970 [Musa balbisiana]|uniref:mRNA (guanine-N(7))-methyltransferase n=1 Tax=Musa balbisiana TaxID=52838 RepID=A0A4S8JL88_MUSBA|nr:hypothetical protein C4D60_Mb01t06970 [Musa balbisiana]